MKYFKKLNPDKTFIEMLYRTNGTSLQYLSSFDLWMASFHTIEDSFFKTLIPITEEEFNSLAKKGSKE